MTTSYHDPDAPTATGAGVDVAERRVLVTGGAGTIGSHLVDLLVREGAGEIIVYDNFARGRLENLDWATANGPVRVVDGDIRDRDALCSAVADTDLVFHLAAIRFARCALEPRLANEVLVDGTFNVLEAAVDAGVQKVVASSCASMHGSAEQFPATQWHQPYDDGTFFGAAKAFNEAALRSFHSMYGLDYVGLRYFNVYGPRMDSRGLHTEMLVHWMERIEQGLPPLILGDGRAGVDLVHVSDIARANLLAARTPVTDEVFNVVGGFETCLAELAELLVDAMGVSGIDVDPGPEPERAANARGHAHAPAEPSALRLGFNAHVGLEEGLRDLVDWWRAERHRRPADARLELVR